MSLTDIKFNEIGPTLLGLAKLSKTESVTSLADKIGVNQTNVSRRFGVSNLKLDEVKNVCEILETPLEIRIADRVYRNEFPGFEEEGHLRKIAELQAKLIRRMEEIEQLKAELAASTVEG